MFFTNKLEKGISIQEIPYYLSIAKHLCLLTCTAQKLYAIPQIATVVGLVGDNPNQLIAYHSTIESVGTPVIQYVVHLLQRILVKNYWNAIEYGLDGRSQHQIVLVAHCEDADLQPFLSLMDSQEVVEHLVEPIARLEAVKIVQTYNQYLIFLLKPCDNLVKEHGV